MKALIYKSNNKIELEEIPTVSLENKTGAIIKALGCGLCGSDIIKIQKDLVPPGTVLGHELVGTIIDIKTELSSFKIGDRIAVAHHYPCYACKFCDQESYSMCETFRSTNFKPGGFAEYVYITEKHLELNAKIIPEGISDIEGSFMEPLACVLRAIDRFSPTHNQTILVVGLGFIGLLFLQVLKGNNYKVIGYDIDSQRLSIARELCADKVISQIKIAETHSSDIVILCSGADATVEFALKAVRDGGKIVIFSSIKDENIGFSNNEIYHRELSILGAYSASSEYFEPAMNYIANNKIKLHNYCTIMDIEEINAAIEKIAKRETLKVYLEV